MSPERKVKGKTAYLCGKMRGVKYFNFPKFDAVKLALEEEGWNVISPADLDRQAGFDPDSLPPDYDWNKIPEGFDMDACQRRDVEAIMSLRPGRDVVFRVGDSQGTGSLAEQALAEWRGLEVRRFWFIKDSNDEGRRHAKAGKTNPHGTNDDLYPYSSYLAKPPETAQKTKTGAKDGYQHGWGAVGSQDLGNIKGMDSAFQTLAKCLKDEPESCDTCGYHHDATGIEEWCGVNSPAWHEERNGKWHCKHHFSMPRTADSDKSIWDVEAEQREAQLRKAMEEDTAKECARVKEWGKAASEPIVTDPDTGGMKGTKPEQCDQIPVQAWLELARHYGRGAAKYSAHNFRKGYKWSLSYNAAMRHLLQFWGGENLDSETGSKHVTAAAWHCLCLATFMDEHPNKDDRYKKEDAR